LFLIDRQLAQFMRSLQDFDVLPLPQFNWAAMLGNPLIREQHVYNPEDQSRLAAERIATFNPEQRSAFNQILHAIDNRSGQSFFLHGPGGTGKTYIYNTLCYHLRGQGRIVLCVASSGIAALLLMGGRTSHSTFRVPILIHESSLCSITKNSDLGELI
ncbi:hypothetical protein FA15DRAFT_555432, partial [Coprinopsis marcescibilis]